MKRAPSQGYKKKEKPRLNNVPLTDKGSNMAPSAVQKAVRVFRRVTLVHDRVNHGDGELLRRFVDGRDEAAFEALVQRHGAMVMNTCLRMLRNQQDAEDAFQATFLVLVRKAASVTPEAVANWLYGVARQTAVRALALNATRRQREKQLALTPRTELPREPWDDLQPLLDRELSRLPEKYRMVVVLCDLEGKTRKEVAQQLGWPEGSVSSRLSRARELLARRLSRRGVALSAAALAELMSVHAAPACTPVALTASAATVASFVQASLGGNAGAISPEVAVLTERVLRTLWLNKLKTVTGLLLAISLAIGVPCFGMALLNNRPDGGQEVKKGSLIPAQLSTQPKSAPQPRLRATLDGERDRTSVALSGDGKLLASVSEDEIVKLWDVPTARELAMLETGHRPPLWSLALSGDGKVLATCGGDGTVKLWDVRKRAEKATLKGHTDRVTAVAITNNGKLVVSGSQDNTVRLWDSATGQEKAAFRGHTSKVTSVAITGDGKWVVSGAEDHTARLWEVATGREVATLKGHNDKVTSVAISNDGKLVASGSEDETAKIWDVASAAERATLTAHRGEVLTVAFSADGKLLASSADGTVKLWDVVSGREKATITAHDKKVTSVAINRDGKLVVSGSADGSVKIWEIP
jgi:RNA polymerase sigma factor (sigma-70 family)